ncbi:MAG: choice-of-anchor A family protein [Luteolibacter sp.]
MQTPTPPWAGTGTLLGLLLAGVGSLSAQNLKPLSDYNVITRGNFSTTSEVEGRTLVGGSLISQNSANFGIKLQGKVSSTTPVLSVHGDIVSGNPLNLNAGSLEIGGNLNNRKINYNGGGSLLTGYTTDGTAIINSLDLASQALSALNKNSSFIMPADQPAAFKFNATPDSNGVAVFSVSASDLFSNNKVQQIELNLNGASDIVINVSGVNIVWTAGNMVGVFNQDDVRDNIVWNFYEATTIDFGSHAMNGQILAPLADVTTSGVINGSIYANSLTTTSEVHLPGYNGSLTLVPEPSSALLGGLGMTLLLCRRKRLG